MADDLNLPASDEEQILLLEEKPTLSHLIEALNRASRKHGIGFMEHLAMEAFSNEKVAMKLLDKLLPNLKESKVELQHEFGESIAELIQKKKQEQLEIPIEHKEDVVEADFIDVVDKEHVYNE